MALLYPVKDPQDGQPDSTRLNAEALKHPFWTLNERQLCDIELLLNGGLAPLSTFMNRKDYEAVLDTMRLADGSFYPMPVSLDVSRRFIERLSPGDKITLRNHENFAIAIMTLTDIWEPDFAREAQDVFKTQDRSHPGVNYLFSQSNPVYISGTLQKVSDVHYVDYQLYRHTPDELKAEFKRRNWDKVVAFQTRNPMHLAHITLTRKALDEINGAGLLLHPVVSTAKPGDVDYHTRMRCYEHALEHYPPNSTILSLLPLAMRMGGPREALWHGMIRKNYGCTHMIIGRDHAGPGKSADGKPFYDEFEAQQTLLEHATKVGITPVAFDHVVYQPQKKEYLFMKDVKPGETTLSISGTELRAMLDHNDPIPEWFTPPQIAEELRRAIPPLKQRGFTVFFTGLSGSGKSTLAKNLVVKLREAGRYNITLLDGDVVRTHLSSELTFSKEHRSLNVQRIGYVASEITKNRGVAICAPIAPYEHDRLTNRNLISQYGGYVEVYLSTPLEICEQRDTKGLYLRARENLEHHFTGINDPYETPVNPEVIIDTTDLGIDEAVEQIYAKIEALGYI